MNYEEAMNYVAANTKGVLATIKRDGAPQLSNISYTLDDDGEIKISVTEVRAKTRNVRRDPRVSLAIIGDNWYRHLVVEGTARIIDQDHLPLLRHVYQRIAGKPHPDWDEYDEAMVRDRRVVMAVTIDRLYPVED